MPQKCKMLIVEIRCEVYGNYVLRHIFFCKPKTILKQNVYLKMNKICLDRITLACPRIKTT